MIDEEGGTSYVIQADVTNEESCKNAVAKTVELWGAVHILVNIGSWKTLHPELISFHLSTSAEIAPALREEI